MQITKGKIQKGLRFCVYGPEGIGKSTFVSQIHDVVFIDTEGSTNNMDVQRYPKPTSWTMLLGEVDDAVKNAKNMSALVIDTADWAERLCIDAVCAAHPINGKAMSSIEDAGYGKGYVYLYEEFGKLLDKMTELSDRGVHVGFTAHAAMRKFEQPDELGAYDRWEMKTSKKVAPLIKEWVDLLLFANYKTFVYATDDKGKKHKASGGERVMYTSHHPCWDAKNRHGLPPEMPFDFKQVSGLFAPLSGLPFSGNAVPDPVPAAPESAKSAETRTGETRTGGTRTEKSAVDYSMVPAGLADLMIADGISPIEVQAAVAMKGYFPMDTPWGNYPKDFIDGVLIGAWPQVRDLILNNREQTPF